jgi:hypothetical protein
MLWSRWQAELVAIERMCAGDPDMTVEAASRAMRTDSAAPPQREHARVRVELTEREVRAVIRATTLVADVLRPELLREDAAPHDSPLVTAYQALIAACERNDVDLGLGAPPSRRGPAS